VVSLRNITNEAKRAAREAQGLHPDVSEHDIVIPIRDGSIISARLYYPAENVATDRSLPILIFFHGGGFCIGNRCDDFESNRAIALRNKAVVVSPEYRLAPEHPFPIAVYDGLDTLQWVGTFLWRLFLFPFHNLSCPTYSRSG
jgi:acetyl esterase/lipase